LCYAICVGAAGTEINNELNALGRALDEQAPRLLLLQAIVIALGGTVPINDPAWGSREASAGRGATARGPGERGQARDETRGRRSKHQIARQRVRREAASVRAKK
jgi:hypothetical protein